MNISIKTLLTLSLLSLMSSNTWAENSGFDFSATANAKNVYSITATSFGLPTVENKGWNSNSHFIVTDNGVLVFDSGSSELIGKGISKAIKSVTNQPIRWVVNSHSHADHWLGNAGLFNKDVEIIASSSAVTTMKKYGQIDVDALSRMTKGATDSTQIKYPTTLLAQAEKRSLGGMDVEFFFSNDGHSQGDVLMWLPKQKIILGGDVLNSDWMPIITPNTNVPHLIETLNTVIKLNPVMVLTGHGKATNIKSVIRDVNFLKSLRKLVVEGFKNNEKSDNIVSQVITKLGPKYGSLYKNFESQIEQPVKMMLKKQKL